LHALHPGVVVHVRPQFSKLGLLGEDALDRGQGQRSVQLRHLIAVGTDPTRHIGAPRCSAAA
jgi:hypothetical protein